MKRIIDPRIKLILLPAIGFLGFFVKHTLLLLPFVIFACLLSFYSQTDKGWLGYFVFFGFLLGVEILSSCLANTSLVFAVYMLIYFLSRMTLIALFGNYIVKTTTISEMIEALNRMKIPRSVSIPFSVLLRFAPTMRHEIKALRENIKIRGVISGKYEVVLRPFKYVEYTLVPLLMRAIKTSDELAASALIRGLDSQAKRITIVDLRFSWTDVAVSLIGILIGLTAVIAQNS